MLDSYLRNIEEVKIFVGIANLADYKSAIDPVAPGDPVSSPWSSPGYLFRNDEEARKPFLNG